MNRRPPLAAALCALVFAVPARSGAEGPGWLEPWLHNAEERTHLAIESADRGAPEEAVEPLETALALAPEDPVARYNAGTARLLTGDGGARALLESAAQGAAPGELLSRVYYNLGNVKMAERDFRAAIETFKDALRNDPRLEDAKFNLELARRALEEEESQKSQDDQEQEDEQEQEQEEEQNESQTPPPPQDEEGEADEGRQEKVQSPLPQFRDLPDMTAEEAAAILEAVENMERERRREDALEAARASARGKKDW